MHTDVCVSTPANNADRAHGTTTVAMIHSVRLRRPVVWAASLKSNIDSTLELDSHADTCVFGSHALIFMDYNRPVNVYGYDPTKGTETYRTVSGAVAYDHPNTGEVFILCIHQAIEIPHLDHHLICPMQ